MAIEIERKFLVSSLEFKKDAHLNSRIKQGFLNRDPMRTVRVRLKNQSGFLTVKGQSSENGMSRYEWEKEISKVDAESLLILCEEGTIDKTRYEISIGKHLFEVDEFHGDNSGLIIAEVELNTVDETFKKPDWLGEEVTGNPKYYNSELSKNPFATW